MSAIDEVFAANEQFARDFAHFGLHHRPSRKLAVVACMDCRINVEVALGLKPGEAHIIRNAGGIVTEDVLRSLICSQYLLGTEEFMVINHTECGMMGFRDEDLREELERRTGVATVVPAHFHSFSDLETNVRRQVKKIRSHPWLPSGIAVRGFVYDVRTGRLNEVQVRELHAAG
ncbi:MAG: beta-class carbonic anhydrase [Terriglobales bacterium]